MCSVSQSWPTLRPHGLQHTRLLSFTISRSLLKLISIESVMPSDHLVPCLPLLLKQRERGKQTAGGSPRSRSGTGAKAGRATSTDGGTISHRPRTSWPGCFCPQVGRAQGRAEKKGRKERTESVTRVPTPNRSPKRWGKVRFRRGSEFLRQVSALSPHFYTEDKASTFI